MWQQRLTGFAGRSVLLRSTDCRATAAGAAEAWKNLGFVTAALLWRKHRADALATGDRSIVRLEW